ncbi:MAG: ubiquinol-cytochrome c reductase iron-sulfur subunit [Prochloraceae cyanobacterium]
MERREFLSWVGVGALAAYLPVAIAACSSETEDAREDAEDGQKTEPSKQTTAKTNAEGFTVIGTTAQLREKGSILNEDLEVIVVRNPETEAIVALNSVCPHKGCNVEWDAEDNNLECPCHDSEFALDGKVLEGPAKEDLAVYEVKQEEDSILVKIA